jgi:rfaE bifunctional protein nucleotidyltransferase chain/domain
MNGDPNLTMFHRKAVSWEVLLQCRARARQEGRTVVWTNGCFDLVHAGHVRNLQAARSRGDFLVVGINSDASVRRLKGPGRPLVPAAQRMEVLAALECVDYVLVFDELTPEAALARLQPDVHCKGGDYAPPNGKPVPEAPLVASYGGRIEFLPLVPDLSTSELIRRIREMTVPDSAEPDAPARAWLPAVEPDAPARASLANSVEPDAPARPSLARRAQQDSAQR